MGSVVPIGKLPPARMLVPNVLHGLGVTGGIPERTGNVIDLADAPYNIVDGDDITSEVQAIITAMATSGSETTILIPPGSFTFGGADYNAGAFTPKNDFTIRGSVVKMPSTSV